MTVRSVRFLALSLTMVAIAVQLLAVGLLGMVLSARITLPATLEVNASTPLAFVGFLIYPLLGGLVATRRPSNPIGWLLLAFSAGVGLSNLTLLYAVHGVVVAPGSLPGAELAVWVDQWLWIIGLSVLPALLLLYPDGRLPSPAWRLALGASSLPAALAAGTAATAWGLGPRALVVPSSLPDAAEAFQTAAITALLLLVLVGLMALVVRFRRGSREVRLQVKWMAVAVGFLLMSGIAQTLLAGLVPTLLGDVVSVLAFMSVPLSIAIAILRYRLYDIDRLVSRTVSYAAVTALLVALYLSVVFVFQLVVAADGALVTAVSTLVVAAAFNPLRRRVQRVVDRRFNRSRYDAQRTIEDFVSNVRDVSDPDELADELERVTASVMQPAGIWVWVRDRA